MKKLNKKGKDKGFTLTELVIVIVIIAILAAVLIPSMTGYVKRAKLSNDTQVCANMTQQLTLDAIEEEVTNVVEAQNILNDAGYEKYFVPEASGYHFYWNEDNNKIILVNDENTFSVYFQSSDTNTVEKSKCYRLDKEYCALSTDIAGVTLSRSALEKNIATEVTFTGLNANSVLVNGVATKVENNKLTLTASSDTAMVISQDTAVYISNVAVNPTSVVVTYGATATVQLQPVFTPTEPATKKVTWTTSDDTVATVDTNGLVTIHNAGTAKITATATDLLGTYPGECNLTVNKRSVTLTSDNATRVYNGTALTNSTVTVSGDGFATNEGATYNVTGAQTVAGESNNTFTYTLNNNTKADNYNITKVEGKLIITKATLKLTITSTNQNVVKSGTVTFTVNCAVGLTAFVTDKPSDSIEEKVKVEPDNNASTTYIVTVTEGAKVGKYTITVTTSDNTNYESTTATLEVNVTES